MSKTSSRKKEHIDITLTHDVAFRGKTTGLEQWEFVNNALPEIDFTDIDPSVEFLGHKLSLPLIISGMTGGYHDAERLNRGLAEACQAKNIAMGVGSQRQAMESDLFHSSYRVVREVAPSIPLIGNIGAVEVASLTDVTPIARLVELIRANAFAVHLNPLQELLQPEGKPQFAGVLDGIEMLVRQLDIPVIVKEIGAGISADVAQRLLDAGVRIIDVAGAGGTSWAGVEIIRSGENPATEKFWDWGIPTAEALRQVVPLKNRYRDLSVIASGGISDGLEMAKAIGLGADIVASARPMLKAVVDGGTEALVAMLDEWDLDLRSVMFLTGSKIIPELQKAPIHRRDEPHAQS
ncbi:MAG: type 2 isopentenyl-diphosphate Delta-isomerase [Bacteroidota bacterium]